MDSNPLQIVVSGFVLIIMLSVAAAIFFQDASIAVAGADLAAAFLPPALLIAVAVGAVLWVFNQ